MNSDQNEEKFRYFRFETQMQMIVVQIFGFFLTIVDLTFQQNILPILNLLRDKGEWEGNLQ